MSDCSVPKFISEDNGKVKVVFDNFSGELTVKDIISFLKYTDVPIPVASASSPASDYRHGDIPPADASLILLDISSDPIQAPAAATNTDPTDGDESTVFEEEANVNKSSDDDQSTVGDLPQDLQGMNLSIAQDDDVEYENSLSQTVGKRYSRKYYWNLYKVF